MTYRMLAAVCATLLCAPASATDNTDDYATDYATGNATAALRDSHFLSDMVPAGHWAARAEYRVGKSKYRFDDDGNRVALSADLDGVNLDANLVPLLAALGPGASLGTTSLTSEISGTRERLTVGYGVTDNITVGFILPYGTLRQSVDFAMVGGNLGANPLFNPLQPISPANSPLLPLLMLPPGTPPVGTAGVQQILTSPLFGYQYKPVGSTRSTGLLDPTIGLRWRAYAGDSDQLIVTPQVRIGMTEKDDADNLFDVHLDDGSTDVIMEAEYQRKLAERFDMRINGKYTWQLPDEITARARAKGETLVPISRKEKLDRDLGDAVELGVELGYRYGDWRSFAGLELLVREPDDYHSPRGQDVSGLEANTRRRAEAMTFGLSWSGVQAYRDGRLPLPLFVSTSYRGTFGGRNSVDSDNLFLTLTAIF